MNKRNLLSYFFKLDKHEKELEFLDLDLTSDLNLYVDPILLYRSSIKEFNEAHTLIVEFFSRALKYARSGNEIKAKSMCQFPDAENYLGIAETKPGHGPSNKLGEKIFEELIRNPDIQEHGLTFLNEFQLLIKYISFDLISDAAVQISKNVFIKYTQQFSEKYGIPTEKVPFHHVLDWESDEWIDGFYDLPINPLKNNQPFLLTPRTIVRRYPEASTTEFYNEIYRHVLMHREESKWTALGKKPKISFKDIEDKYKPNKEQIIAYTNEDPDEKRRFLDKIRPSEEISWIESLSLVLQQNINHVITTNELDYLNAKLIKQNIRDVISNTREAIEHQEGLTRPRNKIIPEIELLTQTCKKDLVLLLGNFSEGNSRLKQIEKMFSKRYQVIRIDDLKQASSDSLLHTVIRIATLARFIVIEDSFPGGQLYELGKIENIGLITAIVREQGKASSFMSFGTSAQFSNIEEFEYRVADEKIIESDIHIAMKWAETKYKEMKEFWRKGYPWRS